MKCGVKKKKKKKGAAWLTGLLQLKDVYEDLLKSGLSIAQVAVRAILKECNRSLDLKGSLITAGQIQFDEVAAFFASVFCVRIARDSNLKDVRARAMWYGQNRTVLI